MSGISDLEKPGPCEDLHKHPLAPSGFMVNPIDGIPQPMINASMDITKSPPRSPETFVCMADCSSFVRRDSQGRIFQTFEPNEVQRMPDGHWYLKREVSNTLKPMVERFLNKVHLAVKPVEPVRPQCEHYRRQLTDFETDIDHRSMQRVCTMIRDQNGEFMSLRDSRVHACELRSPRDHKTEELLDGFDDKAIEKSRKETTDFDFESALAAEGAGGIFSTKES